VNLFRKFIFQKCPFYLLLPCLATSCTHVPSQIEPNVNYSVQERYLQSLPSPFKPLSEEEKNQGWGREMVIGQGFARQLDLYQALTAFKRARILIPTQEMTRLLEIDYEILLCYYIALKWEDVVYTFENSALKTVQVDFPALREMLLMVYDAYVHLEDERGAQRMLQLLSSYFPEEAQKLYLSKILVQGDLSSTREFSEVYPECTYLSDFLNTYEMEKKSISAAQTLNACLPGAGYFYLGQKQSGLTALLLNGLFIGTSIYFFEKGNLPAGILFTSFEAGWYFGGIYGAGLEAKYYNERLYERLATPMMHREQLFPVLMLRYAF
jgi:hypothetical protein